MELSETNGGPAVVRSEMALSESSQESNVAKTLTGSIATSMAASKSVKESIESSSSVSESHQMAQVAKASSVQESRQSTQVSESVQQSSKTISSTSDNKPKKKVESEEEEEEDDEDVEYEEVEEIEEEVVEDEAPVAEESDIPPTSSSEEEEVIIVRKVVKKKKNKEKVVEETTNKITKEKRTDLPKKIADEAVVVNGGAPVVDVRKTEEEPAPVAQVAQVEKQKTPEQEIKKETKEPKDLKEPESVAPVVPDKTSKATEREDQETETDKKEHPETQPDPKLQETTVEQPEQPEQQELQQKQEEIIPEVPKPEEPKPAERENGEIKEEGIKAAIHEILNDIDRHIDVVEALKVSAQHQNTVETSPDTRIPPLGTDQQAPPSPRRDSIDANKENGPKVVDLQKIFTPATDTDEILPSRQRKLFGSSSFYSPVLHPTVEDQVELARRISHSLSDISNQHSKGQSMYVNRKKRSVKWVHEGEGKGLVKTYTSMTSSHEESKETASNDKLPLKLVMNPRGQVQNLETLKDQGIVLEPMLPSPDQCAEVVNALQSGGKGAELFAKRRKKSENWVVHEESYRSESHVHQTSHLPPVVQQPQKSAYSPVQPRQDFNRPLPPVEKYQPPPPRVKVAEPPPVWKTPVDPEPYQYVQPSPQVLHQEPIKRQQPGGPAQITRDLAYRPNIAQGWNTPKARLPTGLYTPPELPLSSYAPPPKVTIPQTVQHSPVYRPPEPVILQRPAPLSPNFYSPATPPAAAAFKPKLTTPPVVRNLSPTPFSPKKSPQTPPHYAPPQPKFIPPQSCIPCSPPLSASGPVSPNSAQKWRNYNTAARGWRGGGVYRPVTFEDASLYLPATDF
ncbi:histone-lysine N-methyltransferase 2D [Sergentomyia squamirostris]